MNEETYGKKTPENLIAIAPVGPTKLGRAPASPTS
jgi:hypothetical protein